MDDQTLDESDTLFNSALEAKEKGDLQTAFDALNKAVELEPGRPAYRLHLALVSIAMARVREPLLDGAIMHATACCKMAPAVLGHWVVLGEVALNCNKFPEAIAAYEKAVEIDPSHAFVWGLLGFAYARNGDKDLARSACEEAVKLDPELGTPHFLLSTLYYDDKSWNPQKVAFHGERAFEAKKPAIMALEGMWNAAHGYLLAGNYPKGFTYLEARLRPNATNMHQILPLQRYPRPLWRGERDTRVLVQTEMGLGDAFIMMRYLPLMKEKFGCEVVFECHSSMLELCQMNFPGVACMPYGSPTADIFDFQIPILSLPLVFKTRSYTVPNDPYLLAPRLRVEEWRARLGHDPAKPTIGVCWFSGRNSYSSDNHETSKRKAVPWNLIRPMLDLPGFNFISLQTERDAEFKNPGIRDFSDTAALIDLCDVVISVDTAVANLAGAMGKELWLMDRFDHCWRWADVKTPWYPNTAIYRCAIPRDWSIPLARIYDDLSQLRDKIASTDGVAA